MGGRALIFAISLLMAAFSISGCGVHAPAAIVFGARLLPRKAPVSGPGQRLLSPAPLVFPPSPVPGFNTDQDFAPGAVTIHPAARILSSAARILNSAAGILNSGAQILYSGSRILHSGSRVYSTPTVILNSAARILNLAATILNSIARFLNYCASGLADKMRFANINASRLDKRRAVAAVNSYASGKAVCGNTTFGRPVPHSGRGVLL